MRTLIIRGGRPLRGTLRLQGAKNSALPILAGTLLSGGTTTVQNCPHLSDVTATADILGLLGCAAAWEGDALRVDASALTGDTVPAELTGKMRSSVVFLGALLARQGRACLALPGGCALGPRPIDLHLLALRALGAEIVEEGGLLRCRGDDLRGGDVVLPTPSVGATENALLCAVGCCGTTTIVGAAREPEIVDLQNFLTAMGADVTGAGEEVVTVRGGRSLHPCTYPVMGDRMAAATYLCAVAAAGGEVTLTGCDPGHLRPVLEALAESGCSLTCGGDTITLTAREPIHGVAPVRTAPHPGFPTDAQPLLMAALAGGRGSTLFVENLFERRYGHVPGLRSMGADIAVEGRTAVVNGAGRLRGADVTAPDLRGGAALVIAALAAKGTTRVTGLHHVERGYDDLAGSLRKLNAECKMQNAE